MRSVFQKPLLVVALASTLTVCGSAQTLHEQTTRRKVVNPQDSALRDAEAAMEQKDFATAESKLKQLASSQPQNYRVWFDLGYVYHATNRTDLAIDAYRKAVSAQPGLLESNLNLGVLLATEGEAEAGKYLRAAEKLKATPEQLGLIGRAWMKLGDSLSASDRANAIDAYQQSARLLPSEVAPRIELGRMLEKSGDANGAENAYKSAAQAAPNASEPVALLSNLYMRQQRFDVAEQNLRQLVQKQPQSPVAHLQLGRVLSAQKRFTDAIPEFEKALELAPTDEDAMRELAKAQMETKKYDAALATVNVLVAKHPEDSELRSILGTIYLRKPDYQAAQDEFMRVAKLRPDSAENLASLALAASGNKQYALAIRALDARAKLEPDNAGTYFLRATCYDHLGAAKEATEQYKQFLSVAGGKFPDEEWKARHRLNAIDPETRKQKR